LAVISKYTQIGMIPCFHSTNTTVMSSSLLTTLKLPSWSITTKDP
jgi:hypothetical protein